MICDTCEEIVKCNDCGKKLCKCACFNCGKCAGQGTLKEVVDCDCKESDSTQEG